MTTITQMIYVGNELVRISVEAATVLTENTDGVRMPAQRAKTGDLSDLLCTCSALRISIK
jgi:hypothetical protein